MMISKEKLIKKLKETFDGICTTSDYDVCMDIIENFTEADNEEVDESK